MMRNGQYMWPDLRKAGFHAHNNKTHFSPSNDSCIVQEAMYFHICTLFLKLRMCLTIHSTPLMLYSYNITYLIMLITNYEAIRIPIYTVVWLLNKTYSLFLKRHFSFMLHSLPMKFCIQHGYQ